MANPIGIVAGLLVLFSSITVQADNHIDKSEIDKVEFTETQIFFKMKNNSIYKGDIVRPRHCPIKPKGVKYGFNDKINNEFVVYHKSGFNTCRFKNMEKIV